MNTLLNNNYDFSKFINNSNHLINQSIVSNSTNNNSLE